MKEQDMIQKKYISFVSKLWYMCLMLGLLVLASCSDVDDRDDSLAADKVNVRFAVTGTRAGEGTENEIADLRMIDFCSDGKVYNWMLYNNGMSGVGLSDIAMALPVGTHKMYFIANGEARGGLLSKALAGVANENELSDIMISYKESLRDAESLSTPLLMTCEMEKTWGNEAMGTVVVLSVELIHTCVKVSYELKFDNSDVSAEELRGKHFQLTSLQFKNLAQSSDLWSSSSFTGDPVEAAAQTIINDGQFAQDTWTYTGVAYIPEYIYESITSYSYLEIIGKVIGSRINSTYRVQLTGTTANPDELITPRGTEYLIAGQIKGLGERDGIEAKVTVVPWTTKSVSVSTGEYRLDVSKTIFDITSDKSDTLYYTSSAPSVRFSLDNELCTYEVVAGNTPERGMIILKANGNIRVTTGGDTGSAVLSATLSNGEKDILTKKMTVNYDFQPFLKVNPQLLVFNWEGQIGTIMSENVVYETNLPNLTIINKSSVPSGHTVGDPHDGLITVTVPTVENTVEYTFTVKADDGGSTSLTKEVKVIVKPDLSNKYRIHFRVINDPKAPSGTSDLKRWGNCYIDVYNETATHVSRFCGAWPGTAMSYTNDAINNGWFVFDLDVGAKPNADGGATKPKDDNAKIEPGISLIMFTYYNGNATLGYQVQQRYPGHKEPGVPLFNFDDHEGWFVYDPTSATGSLQFYDDEPDILDITYCIHWGSVSYSNPNVYLYRDYGSKNNVQSGLSGALTHRILYEITLSPEGNGWYVGSLQLHSLADNQGKELKCSFKDGNSDIHKTGVVFNGQDWTEGWFYNENKKWYSAKP